MLKLSCPSCGAEVKFLSKASVFAVCQYCKSTLVRQDMNLEAIGKMADLQDEISPLQVGTQGYYKNQFFNIIGRLKIRYHDGFWNEWYTIDSAGKEGWLAEAQGFYAVCFPYQFNENFDASHFSLGKRLTLSPYGEFMVDDIHDVVCIFSEGELPMNAAAGRRSRSLDLRGPRKQMATIECAPDQTRIYVGSYQEFDDFKFKHLREIDGW